MRLVASWSISGHGVFYLSSTTDFFFFAKVNFFKSIFYSPLKTKEIQVLK